MNQAAPLDLTTQSAIGLPSASRAGKKQYVTHAINGPSEIYTRASRLVWDLREPLRRARSPERRHGPPLLERGAPQNVAFETLIRSKGI
jgi:hypothetical protein